MGSRVLFGGIWHETNSFCPVPTDLDAFKRFQYVEGEALRTAYAGTNTEMGGIVEASPALKLDLVPTLFAGALPAGMVTRDAVDHVVEAIVAGAKNGVDGVLLVLHGAMVAEGLDEADAYVVRRVREAVGPDCPIVCTFDMHANISLPMVETADILVGYDTLPHVDMAARGREAATLLRRLLDGAARPAKAFRKLNLLTVPPRQGTADSPMRDIMALRETLEREPGIWTVSVAPGFPFCDVPHLGMAVLAYGDLGRAEFAADRLAEDIWNRRAEFKPETVPAAAAVARAIAHNQGLFALVEPADNVGGGAPGDATHVLAALRQARAPSATVVLWDPEAAARACELGVGRNFHGLVGARTLPLNGNPQTVFGKIAFAGPVVYRRDGTYMTGQRVDLGPTAVIDANGIKIVVTSERAMPFDTEHLRSAGIEPENERILTIKCGSAWAQAFGTIASAHLYVDTPGICSSSVERMPYLRLDKRFYPLDPTAPPA
jgi:microcystin degradation protein MlrC